MNGWMRLLTHMKKKSKQKKMMEGLYMMKLKTLILISGDGIGAGKTTLAEMLGHRMTLADGIRQDLATIFPEENWFDRSQEGKNTIVPNTNGKTRREMLILHGQFKKLIHGEDYWVNYLIDRLYNKNHPVITVDDVRMPFEVTRIKEMLGGVVNITHVHIDSDNAIHEPEFDAAGLRDMCDYIIRRNK